MKPHRHANELIAYARALVRLREFRTQGHDDCIAPRSQWDAVEELLLSEARRHIDHVYFEQTTS